MTLAWVAELDGVEILRIDQDYDDPDDPRVCGPTPILLGAMSKASESSKPNELSVFLSYNGQKELAARVQFFRPNR